MWQESDGLDPEDFDPKTFFKMHGNQRSQINFKLPTALMCFCIFLSSVLLSKSKKMSNDCPDIWSNFLFIQAVSLQPTIIYVPFSCVADSNGDGFLDESELEALFTKEVL